MAIQLPPEVAAALDKFDSRADTFEVIEVMGDVEKAITDPKSLSPEAKRGWWAECAAFAFDTHKAPDGGPWKTYFQPMMTVGQGESMRCKPDLRQADAEVLAYWGERAKAVKHPVLAARYADLVWDTTKFVTKGKPGIEFARLAIDSYVAGFKRDDGEAWGDNFYNLGRALYVALSIRDEKRTAEVVQATLDYADKTAEDSKLGTYCYLFDNLLPPEKGPELSVDQERKIVEMFESKFVEMTKPGGPWDVEPHSPREVGERLAGYYQRKGMLEERTRIYRAIAEAFERRAKKGDALSAMFFYQDARKFFLEAGLRGEADRIQAEAQKVGPDAEKQMVSMRVEHEIPTEQVNKFLDGMMEGSMDKALLRLTHNFIPDQGEIAKHAEEVANDHPLYSMFFGAAKKMDHGHIEADVGDETGDPDGKMVHQTAQRIQFDTPWIAWTIERMIRDGLTASRLVDFVRLCGLFTDDRAPLIRQGVEAHIMGNYAQAIHLLIPQIERALVNLPPLAGKPSNKAHRTGRGVMQFKNLNDLLAKDEWPIPADGGEMRLAISPRDLRLLFQQSGNQCAFPGCTQRLTCPATDVDHPVALSEVAHIAASSPEGPRGNHPLPLDERDRYENLILLCERHHTEIDAQVATYPVERLRQMKYDHESLIADARHTLQGWRSRLFVHDRLSSGLAAVSRKPRSQRPPTCRPHRRRHITSPIAAGGADPLENELELFVDGRLVAHHADVRPQSRRHSARNIATTN